MADYIVDFDNKFIERLKEADKALEGLVKTTNNLNSKFEELLDGSLGRFSATIDSISNSVSGLSKVKVGDLGMNELEKTTANSTAKIVDSVSEVSEAVVKMHSAKGEPTGMYKQLMDDLSAYINQLDIAKEHVRDLSLEQMKSLSGTNPSTAYGGFREGFGSEMRAAMSEVDSLMNKISELSNFIAGIKGVSDETFGFMVQHAHDASLEIIKLNNYYREIEKTSSKNYAANERAKENSVIAKSEWEARQQIWEQGFDKIDALEKENAARQSAAAKENNEIWARAYETRLRDYERMFDSIEQRIKENAARENQAAKDSIDAYVKAHSEQDRYNRERVALLESLALKQDKEQDDKEWETYITSPEGALELSKGAKTLREMEEAQKYLKKALLDVNKEDIETIKSLNDAYTGLRISIENLNSASKNEKTIQPSIRNEYVRLLKELEKVQAARLRLSDTEAFTNSDPKAESDYNALLARERDIQTKIKQIRDNSNGLLAEADNQYRADKAQRDLAETERVEKEKADKIKARYKEVLDELRQLEKEQNRIEDLENKYGGDFESFNATNELYRRQQELNNERSIIELMHQDKISDIQEEAGKKRVRDEVDRAERAARLSIEARKRTEEEAEKDRGTYRGAMAYSRSTASIKEQIQAIKYLKEARESLNRGDFRNEKEYRKALNAITLEIDRQEKSIKNLKLETEKINPISGQLKTALTNVFGVAAVKGYVNQLVRIRGEFELQQRSLQVLLRNKDEANRLWKQTIELAVKSPYRVDELVTATKQLAAYRVEANKLHSTTQMLADLSSGLGVDIQRLILAFGQVKAANFLRGTELRQFSEAGINILDELAEHYSNLEGRIVSVGDVFDRVSKRMVSFEDVETVLQGMTGEGGQFYKMQEQQAETLRGQVMNLKDSVLLMYNEIGEMSDGILKGSIAVIRDIIENWKSYANIIAAVVGAIAGYKSIVLLSKGAMALYNVVANAAAVVNVKFGNSATWAAARVRLLNRTMQLNPFVRALAIITSLAAAIGGLFKSFDNANEGVKTHIKILDENAIAAKNAAAGIKELTDERNELLKVENRNEAQEKRLNDITSARNRLLGELTEKNQEYAKSLKQAGDDTEKMAAAIEEQNAKMESQLALAYNLSNIKWDQVEIAQKNQDIMLGAEAKFKAMDKQTDYVSSEFANMHLIGDFVDAGDDLQAIADKIRDFWSNITSESAKSRFIEGIRKAYPKGGLGDVIADYIEASGSVDQAFSTLSEKIETSVEEFSRSDYGQMISEGLGSGLDGSKDEAIIKLQDYWCDVFANENVTASAKDEFIRQIAKIFNLDDDWFSKKIEKELSAWQKGYNELLATLTKVKNIPLLTPVTATTDIKDQVRLLNELKEVQEAIITQYADQQKYPGMLPIHTKEDADNAKFALSVINALLKALGQLGKGGGSKDTRYTNLIKTVNDVYSAFDKLEEKFDKVTATEMLWRDYSDAIDTAFKKVGKSADWVREQFGDLTDKQSLKSALDWIAQNASTKEARLQAQTASAKISVDLEIEARDKEFDKLTNKVEDMFSGYELAIELDKLHVPKEFAKDFFNIDAIDITELRKQVAELKPQFNAKGTEGEKEYGEYLRKLDEMEVKSQQERLKKYQEFTRKAISERAKIMLDSFYEFQEIEKAFQMTNTMALNKGLIDENTKKQLDSAGKSISDLLELSDAEMEEWFLTEDQIVLLREFNAELQRQRELAKEGANQKTKTELDKEAWKQFQTTDTFQMLMSDLDHMSEAALTKMIEQLEQYKEQWKDMPVSDIKELVKTIEQLKTASAGFERPREFKRELRGYLKNGVDMVDEETGVTTNYKFSSIGDAQATLVDSESRIQALEHEQAIVEQIASLRQQGRNDAEISQTIIEQGLTSQQRLTELLVGNAEDQNKELSKTIKKEKERRGAAAKVVGVVEDLDASYKAQATRIQDAQKLTDALFDGWDAINSLFEEDSMSAALASMSGSILDSVLNCLALQANLKASTVEANTFGAAMNAAMGVIGWIVMGIQALTAILKFAFDQHDKNFQKQIDAQQEKVEKLQKEYEELEKQIEKAYMAADLGKLTREAEENLQKQIDATEKMIALEEDKKKTDEDAIDGWKDDIDDMRESIEELHEETFSTLTDGVLDNVLDATRGFVDAWHDAFLETGDGLKGLEESFKDMMQSIVRQQASLTILGPFIDQLKGRLNKYVTADDPILDPSEAADLKQWFETNKDAMDESLENYFGAFGTLFEGGGELSDLEKGIQGMTEDQAEVLAAYWNSCRFMLSNIDMTLTRLASATLSSDTSSNPVLSELKAQTELLRSIDNMFDSVIATGNSSHSGAYLKVFMA